MIAAEPRHGTLVGYKIHGCRCDDCSRVVSAYEKRRVWLAVNGKPATVDATGFKRRVRGLMALGWAAQTIAERLDMSPANLSNRLGIAQRIKRDLHLRMIELYDELSMSVPPDDWSSRRCRTWARNRGYVPPLAWDDRDLDDPDARPHGVAKSGRPAIDPVVVDRLLAGNRIDSTPAEKDEAMRRWVAGGGSRRQFALTHGWNDGRYGKGAEVAS